MSGDHNMYAGWEPRHDYVYKDGLLLRHRIQRTPDGEWEDFVPEDPPPAKKAHMKAFPNMTGQTGMDLRDYFAAKAMQSLILAPMKTWAVGLPPSVSQAAYEIADAMMEAREE